MSADKANVESQTPDAGQMSAESSEINTENVGERAEKQPKSDVQTTISSSEATTDRSRGPAPSSASSTTAESSVTLKLKILEQLGIKNISALNKEDDEFLSYFLQIKLEQERKDVEKLRDCNLEKLNFILDKCSSSETLTSQSVNDIIDIFSNRGHATPRQENDFDIYPSDRKRKRLEPPIMRHNARQGVASDYARESQFQYAPLGPEHGHSQGRSQSQFQLQQPFMFPYHFQYQGGQGPNRWLPQQLGPQGQILAGLGPQNLSPRSNSDATTAESVSGSNPRTTSQNVSSGISTTASQNLAYPPANPTYATPTSYLMPPGSTRRPPGLMAQQNTNQESTQAGIPNYLPPTQQFQPHSRFKGEGVPIRRQGNHRRSQSSITPSSNYSLRSPIKELQATPQKPVNFLIHTPKYPPPT
ncbi:hypothetical protein HG535_0D02510 [Zygotorulaspora mrakii]|uniref:Transcriptional activator POG1 n=1 Tax=Zygotorulaspora mrakii TaxID=42260 RepID=A0A7H9B218_ZYGMR|nr:uncharacterized protein HG535_0D02510 [Zygotorulaspora mrakii]QLG72543.1 hypothetical protein HG535_0D02510 [Zygotorulaspora mrakii]